MKRAQRPKRRDIEMYILIDKNVRIVMLFGC